MLTLQFSLLCHLFHSTNRQGFIFPAICNEAMKFIQEDMETGLGDKSEQSYRQLVEMSLLTRCL